MPKTNASSGKLIAYRIFLAFIVGFAVINSIGILLSLLLPGDRLTNISWINLLAFLAFTALIMWVFHEPSLKRITRVLVSLLVSSALISAAVVL
ncbi:hypothetical protein [Ferrimonas kyonanensis]|uniref:hypothetical protein n=1 Tax=Ferrimonas kyonanensis TaxID=364763 RepID=UPI000422CE71|nr:hypothetical protein [Ferrimonas kyonanensis]